MLNKVVGWEDYKRHISSMSSGHLFRGQANSEWGLQSSYHRSPVSKLSWDRYFTEVLFTSTRMLGNHCPTQFSDFKKNMKPKDFWNCLQYLQHYGFPTPYLDWTESPYVAAYFAFRDALKFKDGAVAIYSIWPFGPPIEELFTPPKAEALGISNTVFIERCDSFGNTRSISQQSYLMLCRSPNTELVLDEIFNRKIPESECVFDSGIVKFILPVSEAKKALMDLNLMNVNGSTLFNNIDGMCECLRIKAELIATP
jgi:hypothetical protein